MNEAFASAMFWVIFAAAVGVVAFVVYQNIRRWWARERALEKESLEISPPRARETHILRLGGAKPVYVMPAQISSGGIVISGWNSLAWRWQIDDYLLIYTDGGMNTRYRITDIQRHINSGWFSVTCMFAPRGLRA